MSALTFNGKQKNYVDVVTLPPSPTPGTTGFNTNSNDDISLASTLNFSLSSPFYDWVIPWY
jgi:hypothetical protein